MSEQYDAEYFLRGKQSGKSLYEDYRWMPDLTTPMVCAIISHLGIEWNDSILDFGCARGYVVKAFRSFGYDAFGFDTSHWATENCDPDVKDHITCGERMPSGQWNWVIAKDVLEHVPCVEETVGHLMDAAKTGVFAVVPLSNVDGQRYVVGAYEKDITHLHRLTLASWVSLFARPGWRVEASYRVRGVKNNYWRPNFERGNGFITARREK